jgi:4-diphosphocytidyl-2-C-methyl-D-erythritol kinase
MEETTVTVPSFAKLNIGLKVLNRRKDGYHNIVTLFQEIDISESVKVATQIQRAWKLTTNVDWIPKDETNTAVRAYTVLKSHFPKIGGVEIHIEKKIPPGTGLGGGSSNAAAVLKAMNRLYDLKLSTSQMEDLAMEIGADVPFFIRGGTQIGKGRGEQLTPVEQAVSGNFLLLIPEISINTEWAYKALKKSLKTEGEEPNFAHFIRQDIMSDAIFENDFEQVVIPAYPEIGTLKSGLSKTGARVVSLSGSGSTVFGVFDDEALAARAESKFRSQNHIQTFLSRPTNL